MQKLRQVWTFVKRISAKRMDIYNLHKDYEVQNRAPEWTFSAKRLDIYGCKVDFDKRHKPKRGSEWTFTVKTRGIQCYETVIPAWKRLDI